MLLCLGLIAVLLYDTVFGSAHFLFYFIYFYFAAFRMLKANKILKVELIKQTW
uniref:Uncharacterized protein n=1 Tax=Strigamia maritima TaxID=126957 RepID=T1J502_STRMM